MKKILLRLLVPLILLTFVVAYIFYKKGPSCDFFTNPPHIISERIIDGKKHTIVEQVSGSHDKVFFIELYTSTLLYDNCGNIISKPIFSDMYNPNLKIEIVVTRNRFKILEAKEPNQDDSISVLWK